MKPYKPEDVLGYATWLTQECQAAGLDAEQYGAEILVRGASNHLSERITCHQDVNGRLRWHWSWGKPIGPLHDPGRPLEVDDIGELVRAIGNVVNVPLRGTR